MLSEWGLAGWFFHPTCYLLGLAYLLPQLGWLEQPGSDWASLSMWPSHRPILAQSDFLCGGWFSRERKQMLPVPLRLKPGTSRAACLPHFYCSQKATGPAQIQEEHKQPPTLEVRSCVFVQGRKYDYSYLWKVPQQIKLALTDLEAKTISSWSTSSLPGVSRRVYTSGRITHEP